MAINLYNIKKWLKMLTGKSIYHVNQDLGKQFIPGELRGYFNNMTEKVTKAPELLNSETLPTLKIQSGEEVYFPVAIFQYGLGAYDLFLETQEDVYKAKFKQCVDWALAKQEESGAWSNFFFSSPDKPYGAMCQGEGASLMLRAYKLFADETYFESAKKAIDFMLIDIKAGGTANYVDDGIMLMEFTNQAAVLNGWIFALFGLYDMTIVCDDEKYTKAYGMSLALLEQYVPVFDNGYWSLYDLDKKLASPFYHNLHIAQMQALYMATGKEVFNTYLKKFEVYASKRRNKTKAFLKKAIQKIRE